MAAMALTLGTGTLQAQTYSLTEMTDETFNQGGDSQWSFERYTYDTGKYTKFNQLSDSSCATYVDIHIVEHSGGVRIPTELQSPQGTYAEITVLV